MKDRALKFYVHPSGTEVQVRLKEREEKREPPSQGQLGDARRTKGAGYEALFRIHCTTCHDNHRWTTLPPDEVRGLTSTEVTSFLKKDIAQTICANCHGIESLYKYRYYHQDRGFRVKIPNE